MLTKLLFPPQWIPTQPYLSLPTLTAFLKQNDIEVEQMDANLSFFDYVLSKDGMQTFHNKAKIKFQQLESENELSPPLQKQYAVLSSAMLFGEYIIDKVEDAKKILKNKTEFYDIEKLFDAFKVLELGLKLASAAFYPTNLTFHSYDMRYSCRSSMDVLLAISDREENLFIEYYENNIIPWVLKNQPGLIGISIINTSQIIPGLTLASLIKKVNPQIHINIGGSIFTRLINEISRNHELFSIIDSVIVNEGETALLALIKNLENGRNFEDIPNLIYRDGTEIKINEISKNGEDVNSLPTPCFDGLSLSRYLSPELILPVLSSRGCYWGRCTFCDHGYGYSGKYRPRDTEKLYNDLKNLKSKYKTDFFTFQDEGLSPKSIGALSDKMIENKLGIKWLADSRFEKAFSPEVSKKLSDAGCKMLYLGLESANDRILKCMDKGIAIENVLNICKHCTDSGIWTHLFLIFGFPTETHSEVRETMDFIVGNNKIIRSMSFGSFQLTKHSKVYENPNLYDVNKIIKNDTLDFSLWYDYNIGTGMSKKETDDTMQKFYNELSYKYKDLPIWSNLDREHLFLYISNYKKANNRVADLSILIEKIHSRKKKHHSIDINHDFYPVLKEGIFSGSFNFNLAKIIHSGMAGTIPGNGLQREHVNVLFDINNNRIFTISEFAEDILEKCKGSLRLTEIIDGIRKKYQLSPEETDSKCRNFLSGLVEKNMIDRKK